MSERRLYGLPQAEEMYRDPAEVWECDIEPYAPFEDRPTPYWTIEVWSARDPMSVMPSSELVLENIVEWAADESGLEGYTDAIDRVVADPGVKYMTARLLQTIAERTHFWIADEMVGEMLLTLNGKDKPMLDGEPLYRPAEFRKKGEGDSTTTPTPSSEDTPPTPIETAPLIGNEGRLHGR